MKLELLQFRKVAICRLLLIFVFLTFCVHNSLSQNQNCLFGYYSFSGNGNDLTINANHGTVVNANLIEDRFGNANSAFSFNGVNSYVDLNHSFDFPEKTFNFWVKARSIGQNASDVFVSDNPSLVYGRTLARVEEIIGLNFFVLKSTTAAAGNCSIQVFLNQWNMISIVNTVDSVYYYFNAQLVCSTNSGTVRSTVGHPTALLGVGRYFQNYFDGVIDDVAIFNCAITHSEVDSLYQLSSAVNISEQYSASRSFDFEIYPNPADAGIVNIASTSHDQLRSIQIANIQGQIIRTIPHVSNQFDISSLQNGIYFLTAFFEGNYSCTKKLVINN